jgi:uncharacterized membrane protein
MSKTASRRSGRETSRQKKRARFEAPAEKTTKRTQLMVLGGVAILVVALITVGFVSTLKPKVDQDDAASGQLASSDSAAVASSADIQTRYAPVQATDGEVRFPLSTFDDGQAHYFSFADAGKSIDFFVLKSSDGVVRAAHDACDVCFGARKGYHQEGDLMICNNCGRQFPSVRINEERGGCNPAPLERTVEGSELVLRSSDIVAGGRYF